MSQFENLLGSDDRASSSKVTLEEWYSALSSEDLLCAGVPKLGFETLSLEKYAIYNISIIYHFNCISF